MRKNIIFVIVVSLFTFISSYSHADAPAKEKDPGLSGTIENGVRVVEVKASRYKFDPDPIVVRQGEEVRLIVRSLDVTHGLSISDFKINISVPANNTESVSFIADKSGSFRINCSVYCGPGHGHMQGALIVEPSPTSSE